MKREQADWENLILPVSMILAGYYASLMLIQRGYSPLGVVALITFTGAVALGVSYLQQLPQTPACSALALGLAALTMGAYNRAFWSLEAGFNPLVATMASVAVTTFVAYAAYVVTPVRSDPDRLA